MLWDRAMLKPTLDRRSQEVGPIVCACWSPMTDSAKVKHRFNLSDGHDPWAWLFDDIDNCRFGRARRRDLDRATEASTASYCSKAFFASYTSCSSLRDRAAR